MIGILILNYKKYQVTADCIRSVLDTGDGLDYHIYVLDNFIRLISRNELAFVKAGTIV